MEKFNNTDNPKMDEVNTKAENTPSPEALKKNSETLTLPPENTVDSKGDKKDVDSHADTNVSKENGDSGKDDNPDLKNTAKNETKETAPNDMNKQNDGYLNISEVDDQDDLKGKAAVTPESQYVKKSPDDPVKKPAQAESEAIADPEASNKTKNSSESGKLKGAEAENKAKEQDKDKETAPTKEQEKRKDKDLPTEQDKDKEKDQPTEKDKDKEKDPKKEQDKEKEKDPEKEQDKDKEKEQTREDDTSGEKDKSKEDDASKEKDTDASKEVKPLTPRERRAAGRELRNLLKALPKEDRAKFKEQFPRKIKGPSRDQQLMKAINDLKGKLPIEKKPIKDHPVKNFFRNSCNAFMLGMLGDPGRSDRSKRMAAALSVGSALAGSALDLPGPSTGNALVDTGISVAEALAGTDMINGQTELDPAWERGGFAAGVANLIDSWLPIGNDEDDSPDSKG